MRRVSAKRRQLIEATAGLRGNLVSEVGKCEFCGKHRHDLSVHEISRGGSRRVSLDQRYALLVLCLLCHDAIHRMAGDDQRALGLALLARSRPEDYSLQSYWSLIGRQFPYVEQIELWRKRLAFIS